MLVLEVESLHLGPPGWGEKLPPFRICVDTATVCPVSLTVVSSCCSGVQLACVGGSDKGLPIGQGGYTKRDSAMAMAKLGVGLGAGACWEGLQDPGSSLFPWWQKLDATFVLRFSPYAPGVGGMLTDLYPYSRVWLSSQSV